MNKQHDIIVIGAGIVGLSIALQLQIMGRSVTVVDRKGVAAEASWGNAGAFAFADIVPLATPGAIRRAPKWLFDPRGPFSVPPSYALKIMPWIFRFWRASFRDRYVASLAAQASLMKLSQTALERQIKTVDGEKYMQREGQLSLYEGTAQFEASLPEWALCKEHDIDFEIFDNKEAIAEIQPGIDSRFTHAGFTPQWINTCDPLTWTQHIAEQFKSRGGQIVLDEIKSLNPTENCVHLTTPNTTMIADQVIVAAGAWSHHLAHTLGDDFPLETERGYNTTLPVGAFDLRTHLTFGGHGFVVSKISGGVRVGGAVELGGLNLPPNFRRSEILLQKASQFLPALKLNDGHQWMGFRPSMPDSLPVIDRSPTSRNVIYAFGHGHLGLTQAAGTAELVASIVSGNPVEMQLEAFSATRF